MVRTGYYANVWFGVYDEPKEREVFLEDGKWWVRDVNDIAMVPMDKAMGYVIYRRAE